ncbi:MAG TPA: hypothetical protein DCF48_05170 [Rikenellaceae bacterium]|nr:hypothetical protein [Rikenellaceae bacterium]
MKLKKWLLLTALVVLQTMPAGAQRVVNRYGLELVRVKGGYKLMDENKIVSHGIFDLETVPGDMYTPYSGKRVFLKDDDFHHCTTQEYVFKTYPGYELKLAVDLPEKQEGPVPYIIWIHGGGWHEGNFGAHSLHSRYLASNGVAGVRISYSLLSQGAVFQDTWQDIQDAIAFIREHAAEWGLDADRFGFAGHSAGGHLAAYAAMRTPGTKLLVALNGIYDLVHTVPDFVPSSRHDVYFNLSSEESRKEVSPVTYVHPGAPYTILTYSTGDTLVDKQQVKTFVSALRRAGVPFDLWQKDYYSHSGFLGTDLLEPTLMRILLACYQHL